MRARDLVKEKKKSKRALTKLFMQGDRTVCRRDGIEKVYDLTERYLPEDIDTSMPTVREYAAYLFETTRRAHGVFTWKQLLHLQRGKPLRDAMKEILAERVDAGVVRALESYDGSTFYMDVEALEEVAAMDDRVRILSPFDNAVIHREGLSSLFGFEYRIECYVAAAKRMFGYFCLPILYGGRFVGRRDCKAHRDEGRLEVISLHLEDVTLDEDRFFAGLRGGLKTFADSNGCSEFNW